MSCGHPMTRQCWRRTDDYTPGTPKLELVVEDMPATLLPYQVLIKVHAVALNYRDANISNGGNPWPVTPNGIICNDAAGEVVEAGEAVRRFKVGDRVAPNTDSENITGRETQRSWLAADEDGVLADYLVFDEWKVAKLPSHLGWTEACIIPCAGVTAWSALKGLEAGQTALIQGTGSLVQSVQCTRRGGIVSQVGYLGKQNPEDLKELLPTLIDRRVNLRGINAGSVQDFEDLVAAISAMEMHFFDIVDTVFPFSQSEEALEYLWQGKQVGKIVLEL